MAKPRIVVTSAELPPGRPMPWVPSGEWPLIEEDGTAAVHMHNIGPEYERQRRGAITKAARAAHEADLAEVAAGRKTWTYGLHIHRAVAAKREDREFYRVVFLSDEDRGLVYFLGLPPHPATFGEIVRRIGCDMARRQIRRALRSLVSRGVVRHEVRALPNGKRARFYSHVRPVPSRNCSPSRAPR